MPRRREDEVYDEYDARAYAHLVPNSDEAMAQYSRKHEKRKKSKQKSHKKSKERGERDRKKDRDDTNSSAVALFGRTNIVDYEDVSSDSADLSDPLTGANSRVSGHSAPSGSGKRAESPASAIRSYMKERSSSPSPVIRDSSPYNRTEGSSRKSKKRPRVRSPVEELSKTKYIEQSPPRTKYSNPPRAYAAEPPRAYAEVSKYSGALRNYSPPSSAKKRNVRYRSRSPTSPYGRRKSRSRSR